MKKLFHTALVALAGSQLISFHSAMAGNDNSKDSTAKSCFYNAKHELENMLSEKSALDYERAVFVTENAYWENTESYENFQNVLTLHTERIKRLAAANNKADEQNFKPWYTETVEQKKEKYRKLLDNWAIYTYITDTIYLSQSSNLMMQHLPFEYATNDPLGTINRANSQVFSLLNPNKRTGNCYALASLFKIFSERLNTDAKICTAPSHIWIRHKDLQGTSYNVELAARAFPGLGKLETLTYTTDEGTINDISMRTLDLKKSVTLCLVQLAKGYEHKFKNKTDDFILNCSELALKYDSLNLNAMLLKAEVLEERIIQKNKSVTKLQTDKEFNVYQKLIANLYKLGYREMPLNMKNLIIAEIMKEAFIVTHKYIPNNDTSYITLSHGIFEEMHEKKPKEKYFRTIFNTSTKKIERFTNEDTLYNKYYFDPVAFALNVNPSTSPASISPYSAMNGNPILYNDPTGESGEVAIDKQSKTITITSNIVFYGSQASATLATQTANDIQNKWNAANGKVNIGGTEYSVKFSITGEYKPGLTPAEVAKNTDIKNNYIRVEEETNYKYGSYTDKIGSSSGANTGEMKLSDISDPSSTTESHEYGHGLGLGEKVLAPGNPGIMAQRGTTDVEAKYKYRNDPNSTLDPSRRKVTPQNIKDLNLDKLVFDKNGKAKLGKLTNEYHEKKQ